VKRFLRLLLVLVILGPYLLEPVGIINAVSEETFRVQNMIEEIDYEYNAEVLEFEPMITQGDTWLDLDEQELTELNALVGTLGEPLGMQGFLGDYALDDLNEVVEIIVQFVTPPAVALRLMQERELPQARTFSDNNFEEQALSAHENFNQQLERLPVAFSDQEMEIFSTHYWLFNGVFMRVPSRMVEQIATLPEVFSVTPNMAFHLIDDLIIEEVEVEEISAIEASNNARSSLFASPELLREARAYFNMDYVHHELGITGAGVRVAVFDTGIDRTHPAFARFLDDEGRIPGHHFFDNDPALAPDGSIIPLNTSHGTTVSGIVAGMAPNIELWHYRVTVTGSTGGSLFSAIETAHRDAERDGIPLVMNLSLGSPGPPFSPFANVLNLLSLDGTVVVGSAGNSVGFQGGFSDSDFLIVQPGAASLAISVGGGTAGGVRTDDTIAHFPPHWGSSRGPLLETYHIKPDIIVPGTGLRTTLLGGGYGLMSHTSSSAPFAAGLAALMVEAFPDATPQEIKARMMNTARPFRDESANRVFRAGAGFVRPVEAVTSESFVTVEHLIPLTSNRNAPFEMGTMASFSFGELRGLHDDHANGMTATITNNHQTAQTYTIDYYFTNNPHNVATLSFDRQSVTIGPNQTGTFTVTLSMREGFIPEGFYEGYVNVRLGGDVVARLPFGLVNTADINYTPQTITFDLAGGHVDGSTANIQIVINRGNTIGIANIPTMRHPNTRYGFAGWQENGMGPILTREEVGAFEVRGDTRFVAVWAPITEWEQLRQHISALPVGEHVILLTQDISATGAAIEIPAGRTIRLESIDANIQILTQTINDQRHFIVGNDVSLILGENITLSGGVVNNSNNSGGVQVNWGGTLTMEEDSIIENCHREIDGGAVALNGIGTAETTRATFIMNAGTIRNNSGANGGGVSVSSNGQMIMTAGTIEDNNATAATFLNQGGGGVALMAPSARFTMSGGTIQSNEASTGGGVFANTNSNFEMSGTATITDNIARATWVTAGGGGVKLHNATFTMTGGTISYNRNPRGAGVFIGGAVGTSQMIMSGGVIYNNTASAFGGGVSVGANWIPNTPIGTFTMTGGTIYGNTSTGPAGGGGVHVGPSSTFTMNHEDARIEANRATHTTATNGGGGISLVGNIDQGNATFNLIAGTIEDNQASSGGGIHVGANAYFEMTGGTISHNHANVDGGGLFTTVHTYQSPLPEGMHYTNITIGANVNFSDNTAGGGAFMPPNNAATATNIAVTATRSRGLAHALNNLDINFRGGTQIQLHPVRFLDGETVISSIEVQNGEQLTTADIPEDLSREGYNFMGWSRTPGGEVVEPLVGLVITAATDFHAIWQPEKTICPIIAEGQFADGVVAGSVWRVCEDGTLEVEEGFINWYAPPSPCESFSAVSPWHEYRHYINRVVFKGEILAGTSLGSLFSNLTQVTEIEGLTYFDTTNVRNMSWMFNQANSLTELDLSSFDTSQVTTMNRMFRGTSSLTDLDIGHFSTSNVVDMGWMFFGASNLVELDVSNFNTSNVTNMGLMFREMSSLVELDVSNFDTGNVLDMREMFRATRIAQLDLSSFNTSHVVNMNHMFTGMNLLTELTLGSEFSFIGNAGLPTIRQTESYTGLWQGPSIAFTSTQLMAQFDGSTMAGTFVWQEWTVPVTCEIVARGRFANGITVAGSEWRLCENGTLEVDEGFINWISNLSPWNAHRSDINQIVFTGPITAGSSLRGLFRELTELTEIEGLTYFDTSATWDMHRMFFGASSLTSIDVTSFDTSNVTDMAMMFREATRLVELDVSTFDTGNVVDMREMFRGTQIVHLDLTGFDTGNVVNMNWMFTGMISLRRLTLGSEFSFIGSAGLPGAGGGQVGFTNRWQNVGNGTVYQPTGQFVFTTTQLMAQFNGSTMADTFVWQPR